MRTLLITLEVVLVAALFCAETVAAPFAMFPKAGELASPDRRFIVRNVDREGSTSDFAGTFHALWLTDLATGRSRKLYDYVGLAAVAWTHDDFLIVTDYLGRSTSRALVFSAAREEDPVVLDKPSLILRLPVELRPALRENSHIFIEASRLEQNTLYFTVWGYGQHDANGFHWRCEFDLRGNAASCADQSNASQQ